MNKDVIYIDVDDDVTAIIGKIKKAKEKIVAIVPPKRAGALQSAVNLRLLERMAKNDNKKLVLITNNQALVALAANAQIPVAKNLQSKPELAEIPAIVVDDSDDIIDGSELPVGDHADSVKGKAAGGASAKGSRTDAIENTDLNIDGERYSPAAAAASAVAKKAKGRSKIPNFDTFRKKLFLGIGGAVVLIGLLIWMFVFAPGATVVITARTTPQSINATVRLGGTAATNTEDGIVNSVLQEEKKDVTVEFDATGQKDVGEKATGTVRFATDHAATAINGVTIPAGTRLTASSGHVFVTNETASLGISNYTNVQVGVTAAERGDSYNGASGSLSGTPDKVSANFVGSAGGGTSKIAKVVSADDIERAKGQIAGKSNDDVKEELIKKFANDEIVIEDSFVVDQSKPVSSPAVNQEAANGKATLSASTAYSIHAVAKAELDTYLKASLESKIDKDAQKVYSSGIDSAALSNFRNDDGTSFAMVNATGAVGPQINEEEVKEQVKGKRFGEVQQGLEAIEGIQEVDVKFSFFWVRTVPNDTNKIKIEFKVQDE